MRRSEHDGAAACNARTPAGSVRALPGACARDRPACTGAACHKFLLPVLHKHAPHPLCLALSLFLSLHHTRCALLSAPHSLYLVPTISCPHSALLNRRHSPFAQGTSLSTADMASGRRQVCAAQGVLVRCLSHGTLHTHIPHFTHCITHTASHTLHHTHSTVNTLHHTHCTSHTHTSSATHHATQ